MQSQETAGYKKSLWQAEMLFQQAGIAVREAENRQYADLRQETGIVEAR